jgi:hypothetical protein
MSAPSTSFIKRAFFFSFLFFYGMTFTTRFTLAAGVHLTALIWSFWTLCLPFFGGGAVFSIFFRFTPEYLLELYAWGGAIILNIVSLVLTPQVYHLTPVTHLLQWVLTHPFPYWIIPFMSLLPIAAAWVHTETEWLTSRIWYLQLQLLLTVLAFTVLGYFALNDFIILSNIHA